MIKGAGTVRKNSTSLYHPDRTNTLMFIAGRNQNGYEEETSLESWNL
jgi:hypothetical protein